MTIFYFTATGNCLSIAKKFSGKLISLPHALRLGTFSCMDDAIGLIFPVFGLSVPPLILDFIKKVELKSDYLFAILTYGTYDAGAVSQLIQAGDEYGKKFAYINALHMQENYLPGFAMEKQKAPSHQAEKTTAIVEDIANRKNMVKHNTWLDRFMTWTHQKKYHYVRGAGFTKQYSIMAGCSGCGTCARICPTCNIQIENGRPVFGTDCLSCLSCSHICPLNVIRMSNEKSLIRYRNPEVSLAELIAANNQPQ